ncbi:receptor-like protein EIX1 [Cryptomeria japonica]|uniref:receptor-like protein EIX1 n=1 Tax=Cryptomeria japonica TaxID=3369 RepID=UPI0027DA5350|nr:receptor-like protein EIX1 [Cryptomeria japonica]
MSSRCPSHESQALLRFKAALNDSHGYLSSWVNGTDCCRLWEGISCDNHTNHVVFPIELEFLSYLGSLNLSNNNLSGSIPQGRHMTGTFGESSYSGNPSLWGCPLPKNSSWPQFVPPPPLVSINKRNKNTKYPWYEIALGLSYGVSFGGIISIILIKMSWRRKYFNKVDTILKLLFPWMKNLTL